ncbi:quercetin dioxygenase-like cupin family protein [Streptomyces glaucescens]
MDEAQAGADDRERFAAEGPRVLCDVEALSAAGSAPSGALWRLAEPGRQLDANLVRIPPEGGVATHVEPELDVLVLVVAGDGTLGTEPPQPLTAGSLVWLPHGSARSLTAGQNGLSYVTVHRRRPGMQIQPRPTA